MLRDSNLPPRFWAEAMMTFMCLRNRMPTRANDGITPYECFYGMKPDVRHIRTFGYIVHVTLPSEKLRKLEDHRAMGYLMGYKYEGAYHVWIPHIGVKEVQDVTLLEGTVPVLPDHGSIAEVQRGWIQDVDPLKTTPGPTIPVPTTTPQATGNVSNEENGAPAPATVPPARESPSACPVATIPMRRSLPQTIPQTISRPI